MESLIQTRVKEFENSLIPLKNYISGVESKSLEHLNNLFFDAFRTLGIGELYARQFDRESQLERLKSKAANSQILFKKYNGRGIIRVTDAINSLVDVQKEFTDIGKSEIDNLMSSITEVVEEFKLECTNLEIKGKDVVTLFKSVDEIVSNLSDGGVNGVIKHINGKMQELISLRESDNRGAIDNFPLWKVAAIVVGIGVWIIAFVRCGVRRCTIQEGAAYFIILAIAAMVGNFC